MDFKQKAEEKKMSMSKNIARLAVTAGLTAALSFGGVMAPVTMAFADGTTAPDNGIIIEQSQSNTDTTKTKFVPYQIFKAKVVDGADGKVASDVDWAIASQAAKDEIVAAIHADTSNGSKLSPNPSAQDVADWLGTYVSEKGKGVIVKNGDLLNKIAAIVKKYEQPSGTAFDAGASFTTESAGYYLFLTDDNSIGTKNDYSNKKQTGTSPIFAVVGGTGVTVTEKTGIPTVTKEIKDDKPNSNWADKADSQMGQDVQYRLTGTVADNIATFDTYYYEFRDELPAGLIADQDSVKVTVYANDDDATGTEVNLPDGAVNYNTTKNNNLLTVKFDNLKAVAAKDGSSAIDITKDSKVVVTYTAKLNPAKSEKVTVGGTGNANEVKLIYSNNPMSDGKGESVPDTVRDYTYALKLVKQDHESKNKLQNVGFTIQATDPDDNADGSASKGKYVQEYGNLADSEHEFFTDEKGEIYITGLDAGTYTVHEKTALGEYNSLKDFTFTISTPVSGEGSLRKTEVEAQTVTVTRAAETSDLVILDATQTDGTVNLTVENKKGSGLPLTGLNGVTFTWIAGGAVLCIGVAHLVRSRKKAEESEQE